MVTDPASDLQQYIGETVYTALEAARLGYMTDTQTATDICTGNIMAAVYAARPAISPQPAYPPAPSSMGHPDRDYQPETRPRHSWRGR